VVLTPNHYMEIHMLLLLEVRFQKIRRLLRLQSCKCASSPLFFAFHWCFLSNPATTLPSIRMLLLATHIIILIIKVEPCSDKFLAWISPRKRKHSVIDSFTLWLKQSSTPWVQFQTLQVIYDCGLCLLLMVNLLKYSLIKHWPSQKHSKVEIFLLFSLLTISSLPVHLLYSCAWICLRPPFILSVFIGLSSRINSSKVLVTLINHSNLHKFLKSDKSNDKLFTGSYTKI